MVEENRLFNELEEDNVWRYIAKTRENYLTQHPDKKIISLGMGDTTQAIPSSIYQALLQAVKDQGKDETYIGYCDKPDFDIRSNISKYFYQDYFSAEEIQLTPGAIESLSFLGAFFGTAQNIAFCEPSFPSFMENSIIFGAVNKYDEIQFLPTNQENNYVPDFSQLRENSIVYLCSPNNPTGRVYDYQEMKTFVDYANKTKSIIIFDAAYSSFIREDKYPKSIFEIEGANTCAIEVNSLSKPAGFTGIRFSWVAISKDLKYNSGKSILENFDKTFTLVNLGPSILARKAARQVLTAEGMQEVRSYVDYYLKNGEILKDSFDLLPYPTQGGTNAPYFWINFKPLTSVEAFNKVLNEVQLISVPGSGFGPSGEGYLRFSSFGNRDNIIEAAKRLKKLS